ncbi:MAG: FAD:protein FMN transferase [Vicinamibacterales bacterium]
MGTRFELALVKQSLATVDLRAVGELALREIEEWHLRLTRFEPGSWLSHVNRTAAHEPVRLDDEVFPLFADAVAVWRDSDGAFDIARGHGAAVALDEKAHTLRFLHELVALDLGAIAKGHALDCAAACLRSHGVTRALLQGGTSSAVALGRPLDATAWRIGMSATGSAEVADQTIDLVDESFSLSDEASQPEAPSGRHITDPRAAAYAPPSHPPRRVIVTGPTARLADAWSTALAVLGAVPPEFPAAYTARFLRE